MPTPLTGVINVAKVLLCDLAFKAIVRGFIQRGLSLYILTCQYN